MKKIFFEDRYLVFSLVVAMVVAATEVPLWVTLFSVIMVAWKFLNEKMQIPKLSVKLTPLFGLALFFIVYLEHKTIFGQEESTTILLGLTAITILNYEVNRDRLFLILLGFMIVVLKSIFSTDVFWMIPTTVSFFGLWISLISNSRVSRPRYVYQTFLRAAPLLIVLFVVFPRIVLFETKQAYNPVAQSGFSEDLTPGQLERVATSNQMVFRAEFLGNSKVLSKNLYWRGGVLKNSNGLSWFKGRLNTQMAAPVPKDSRETIEYKVVLEPLNIKNVFVLESPLRVFDNNIPLFANSDLVYKQAENQSQVLQFFGQSALTTAARATDENLSDPAFLKAPVLQERSRGLVERIKAAKASLPERLLALETFFKINKFTYTLNPDAYGNDMDQFLFDRKKGFCEHYAAAFASLARNLDIPSRVVIGYQGGTYNSLGNFWRITQKDAHAWVEVLIDGGWQRVDPTSLVSPLRISLGAEEYFSLSEEQRSNFVLDENKSRYGGWGDLGNNVMAFFESVNYKWTLFLLDYDSQKQLALLKSVQAWWIYVFLALMFPFFGWYFVFKQKQNTLQKQHEFYPILMDIENWCRKNNINFAPSTTPLKLLARLPFQFANEFAQDYVRVVYEEKPPLKNFKWWQQKWKSVLK